MLAEAHHLRVGFGKDLNLGDENMSTSQKTVSKYYKVVNMLKGF